MRLLFPPSIRTHGSYHRQLANKISLPMNDIQLHCPHMNERYTRESQSVDSGANLQKHAAAFLLFTVSDCWCPKRLLPPWAKNTSCWWLVGAGASVGVRSRQCAAVMGERGGGAA